MRRLLLITLVVFFVIPFLAQAQDLTETYVSEAEGYVFNYPSDWVIEVDSDGFPLLSSADSTIFTVFFGTAYVNEISRGSNDPDKALQRVLTDVGADLEGQMELREIGGRDSALVQPITMSGSTGLAALIAFDGGGFGAMIAFAGNEDDLVQNQETLLAVLESFNAAAENTQSTQTTQTTTTQTTTTQSNVAAQLDDADGDWEDAIAELESLGMIPEGGRLVFEEDSAFFSGRGSFFTGLASSLPNTHIVMAAELSFTVGSTSETETCSLLARVVTDNQGNATTYLDVGIDNEGSIYFANLLSDGEFPSQNLAQDVDFSEPLHLLFLAVDDQLTVYVNGELRAEGVEIEENSGTYGIALRGAGAGARCEGRNIWVVRVGSFTPSECSISSANNVNKRSGPGTNFDQAGQLRAGTTLQVIGQATGADGFVWWQLEDETWVRADIVNEDGDCESVPQVNR